jgi:hypothetical protein
MFKIPLDPETERALAESGIRELRPPHLQAVVLLRRALGLPVPKESPADAPEPVAARVPHD